MNELQILLGSNSEPEKHMSEARERLINLFPQGIRFSENLFSAAVKKEGATMPAEKPYLNALCQAYTELPLESVRSLLKNMEFEMGRIRGIESNGIVSIDLDLVLWNVEVLRPKDVAQKYYQDCLINLHRS